MQIADDKTIENLKKIAEKKKKLESKERQLKAKNRKAQIKRFIEVGNVAARHGLDTWDNHTLSGAFGEIKERAAHSPTVMEDWRKRGELSSAARQLKLIISFMHEPDDIVKKSLKERQFRRNTWREEWYGYGLKDDLESIVKEIGGRVEVAKD